MTWYSTLNEPFIMKLLLLKIYSQPISLIKLISWKFTVNPQLLIWSPFENVQSVMYVAKCSLLISNCTIYSSILKKYFFKNIELAIHISWNRNCLRQGLSSLIKPIKVSVQWMVVMSLVLNCEVEEVSMPLKVDVEDS